MDLNKKEIIFVYENDTKNKKRFKEVCPLSSEPVVGYLYVSKKDLIEMGDPVRLKVIIESDEK